MFNAVTPAAAEQSGWAKFWSGRRVLVTGGTGFLGAVLLLTLVAAGADVTCLRRRAINGHPILRGTSVARVRTEHSDIRDEQAVTRVLKDNGIDTVFHLAAQTIVSVANKNPIQTFDVNVRGTWTVLEACRNAGVGQVVVASSDKAYGDHATLPYREDAPLVGRHPYDVSKSCTDLIASTYAKTYGLNVAITRCGNFYGGGDLYWNRIVPGTIRAALRGERPLIRSDGKSVRDYLYVQDAAEGYLALAHALSHRGDLRGGAFNFSGNNRVSVLELVGEILALTGTDLEPDVRNEASNEIGAQYLDATKARDLLGWSPRYTLRQGLRETIAWYRDHLAMADEVPLQPRASA